MVIYCGEASNDKLAISIRVATKILLLLLFLMIEYKAVFKKSIKTKSE